VYLDEAEDAVSAGDVISPQQQQQFTVIVSPAVTSNTRLTCLLESEYIPTALF